MAGIEGHARRSHAKWQALVAPAGRSGLSTEALCRAEGISTASLYSWRKRLASEQTPAVARAATDSAGRFIDLGALSTGAPCDAGRWDIELQLGAEIVLRLRRL